MILIIRFCIIIVIVLKNHHNKWRYHNHYYSKYYSCYCCYFYDYCDYRNNWYCFYHYCCYQYIVIICPTMIAIIVITIITTILIGSDGVRSGCAQKALQVLCTFYRAGAWEYAPCNMSAASSPSSTQVSPNLSENVSTVLGAKLLYTMWQLVQHDWARKSESEQQQSVRALKGLVALMDRSDLSKFLPQVYLLLLLLYFYLSLLYSSYRNLVSLRLQKQYAQFHVPFTSLTAWPFATQIPGDDHSRFRSEQQQVEGPPLSRRADGRAVQSSPSRNIKCKPDCSRTGLVRYFWIIFRWTW